MKYITLPTNTIFNYRMTGKFTAPHPRWKHLTLDLNDYELIIMTENTLYLTYDKENYTVHAGEYLLLPPSSSNREGFRESNCSFYWLHFTTPALPVFDEGKLPSSNATEPLTFSIPETGRIPKLSRMVVLMKQLQDMVKYQYPVNSLNSFTTAIVTELFGQLSVEASHHEESQNQIYLDIIDFISKHIHEDITPCYISNKFGFNEQYLSRRFNSIVGVSLKQYIQNQKIEAANYMLRDTNKPISDIAEELCFTNVYQFSRIYKRITGLSPSEYRNTYAQRLLYHV